MEQTNDRKTIEDYLNNNLDNIEKFELKDNQMIIHTKDKIITITEGK